MTSKGGRDRQPESQDQFDVAAVWMPAAAIPMLDREQRCGPRVDQLIKNKLMLRNTIIETLSSKFTIVKPFSTFVNIVIEFSTC